MGVSQSLAEAAGWAGSASVSRFVNLRKSEAEREQAVLLADGPRAGKAEALAQPQHGLEALDRASGCREGLKAADPRHALLDPEVVALDPLCNSAALFDAGSSPGGNSGCLTGL